MAEHPAADGQRPALGLLSPGTPSAPVGSPQMSKAFTREDDEQRATDLLPDRAVPTGPNLVTAEGLVLIEDAIARLQAEQDVECSADNTAEIARLARDLRYWTARRSTAQ